MGNLRITTQILAAIVCFSGLFLSGCQEVPQAEAPQQLPPSPPPIPIISIDATEYLTVLVTEVSDGDIFSALDAYGQDAGVRLYGVDCPEPRQPFGADAANFTRDRCLGEYVQLRLFGADVLGRHVAVVTLPNGDNLNEKLVEAGYAHWFQEYVPDDKRLAYFQATAQRDRRGLWADPEPVPPWEYRGGPSPRDTPLPITRSQPSRTIRTTVPPASRPPMPVPRQSTSTAPTDLSDTTVYITNHGDKYHRGTCHYLKSSRNAIDLSRARGSYAPCTKCRPPH